MLRSTYFIFVLTFAPFAAVGWAERLSDDQAKDATHVVTGTVQRVFTRETPAQMQYLVEIKADQVESPASLKPGGLVLIYCFQARKAKADELPSAEERIEAMLTRIGETGHHAVPREGQMIRALAKPRGGRLEGLYPDWFTLIDSKKKAQSTRHRRRIESNASHHEPSATTSNPSRDRNS